MPEGKSVYDTYFEAGSSMGEYQGTLQKVADVWSDIDFSREKFAWETEQRERNLDTLLATTELIATVGGSMEGFKEGSAAIARQTGGEPEKIGRGGKAWDDLTRFEKMWQRPRYQFGDDTIMSKSQIRKYGRDVKEFGKYGVDLPLDMYQTKSMHAEYREGYDKEKYWYPGKHATKLAQTLVPGGETGYMDLYSGVGKPVASTVTPVTTTSTNVKPQAQSSAFSSQSPPGFINVSQQGSGVTADPKQSAQTGYKYEEGDKNVIGSEDWFQSVIKGMQRKKSSPSFTKRDFKKYNKHLFELAVQRGYNPQTLKWE